MIVAGRVTSLEREDARWFLSGRLRRGEPASPVVVTLTIDGRFLARTNAVEDGGRPNALKFRVVVSDRIAFVLAPGSGLKVECDGSPVRFSAAATAARSVIPDDRAGVERVLRKIELGHSLTRKGLLKPPFHKRGDLLGALLAHYTACDAVVKEFLGYHLHVVGGTMLGLLRNGGAIGHDLDFDCSYLSRHSDPRLVKREFFELMKHLTMRGHGIEIRSPSRLKRQDHFKWFAPGVVNGGTAHLDVLPSYVDADGFYCRPTFVRIPGGAELINPLRRLSFEDAEVWAPNRMMEKALLIFGDGWRVPDPFWRKPSFAGVREALDPLGLDAAQMDELAALAAPSIGLARPEGARI